MIPSRSSFVAAAVSAIVVGAAGYLGGYHTGTLAGDVKVTRLERQYANSARVAADQALAKEHAQAQRAAVLASDLFTEKARHAIDSEKLKRRIASVTSRYRPAPDAPLEALPRCVFTVGFVRVWNAAASTDDVPASGASAGTIAQAGSDGALDSGVREDDILAYHLDAARRTHDIESQLNKLIDFIEGGAR